MNKNDTAVFFDRLETNPIYGENMNQLAESRAVLDEIDLVKTRVWGLLSKDFLQTKNPLEVGAFYEFVTNIFTLSDFSKYFSWINKKVNGILRQADGNILEYLIVETLSRNDYNYQKFSIKKGSREMDEKYKSDLVTIYEYKGKEYKIGAQITTIDNENILTPKIEGVSRIITEIDNSKDECELNQEIELDSMIFIQLNGMFTTYLGKGKNILQKALLEWKNKGYKGDLIEYIENINFSIELLRFYEIYPFIIGNYFKIINSEIGKKGFVSRVILAPSGEKIKVDFQKSEGIINFSIYDGDNFLFKIFFYVNEKLLSKMYPQNQNNPLKVANF